MTDSQREGSSDVFFIASFPSHDVKVKQSLRKEMRKESEQHTKLQEEEEMREEMKEESMGNQSHGEEKKRKV